MVLKKIHERIDEEPEIALGIFVGTMLFFAGLLAMIINKDAWVSLFLIAMSVIIYSFTTVAIVISYQKD